jgi:hypothetical protein
MLTSVGSAPLAIIAHSTDTGAPLPPAICKQFSAIVDRCFTSAPASSSNCTACGVLQYDRGALPLHTAFAVLVAH